jgi:cell division protease FtsH
MMALASKRSQYLDGGYGMDCAQDTAAALDEAVRGILDQCYATAVQILQDSRADMDKVVAYLLEKETITGSEMVAIIQGRDPAEAESPFLEGGSTKSGEPEAAPVTEAPVEARSVPEEAPEEKADRPPQAEPAEEPQDQETETE